MIRCWLTNGNSFYRNDFHYINLLNLAFIVNIISLSISTNVCTRLSLYICDLYKDTNNWVKIVPIKRCLCCKGTKLFQAKPFFSRVQLFTIPISFGHYVKLWKTTITKRSDSLKVQRDVTAQCCVLND